MSQPNTEQCIVCQEPATNDLTISNKKGKSKTAYFCDEHRDVKGRVWQALMDEEMKEL